VLLRTLGSGSSEPDIAGHSVSGYYRTASSDTLVASSSAKPIAAAASMDWVAIVVVRLAVMTKLYPVVGPRVIFSLLRRLGKATDRACVALGGRRLRMLEDGAILGFGLKSIDSPNGPSEDVQNALRASESILRDLAAEELEMQAALGPYATIHCGPLSVGVFGSDPSNIDCTGPAVDAALFLSQRVKQQEAGRPSALCLSATALAWLQAEKPESPLLFQSVLPPVSSHSSDIPFFTAYSTRGFIHKIRSELLLHDSHNRRIQSRSKVGKPAGVATAFDSAADLEPE